MPSCILHMTTLHNYHFIGTECASGWTALSDKCVKLLSSEQASLAAAQRACREATRGASDVGDARLITLTAASQITELSQQLSLRKCFCHVSASQT